MTHPDVEQVAELLEGALPPAEEQRLREHLAGCAECGVLVEQLADVSAVLRAQAQVASGMPEEVAQRLQSTLADEVARRQTGATEHQPPGAEPEEGRVSGAEVHAGSGVTSLADRRTRRRRALAGGLLAAAAVTVAAVGLGELFGSGGSSGLGEAAGSAGVTSADRPAPEQAREQTGPGIAEAPTARGAPKQDAAGGLQLDTRLRAPSDRNLIALVAEGHVPGRVRLDRADCVRAVLGDGADLGSVASYAVRLPPDAGAARGGAPGVVVLRPRGAPAEGLLVACSPEPHVVLRRGLSP